MTFHISTTSFKTIYQPLTPHSMRKRGNRRPTRWSVAEHESEGFSVSILLSRLICFVGVKLIPRLYFLFVSPCLYRAWKLFPAILCWHAYLYRPVTICASSWSKAIHNTQHYHQYFPNHTAVWNHSTIHTCGLRNYPQTSHTCCSVHAYLHPHLHSLPASATSAISLSLLLEHYHWYCRPIQNGPTLSVTSASAKRTFTLMRTKNYLVLAAAVSSCR